MENKTTHTIQDKSLQKCKLIVTVVDRKKAEFYFDFLQGFRVNLQYAIPAEGTAQTEMLQLLGLKETEKAVLLSVIREDSVREALAGLEEKFRTVRGGKGIAFTIPLSSVIGVTLYRFLSDQCI